MCRYKQRCQLKALLCGLSPNALISTCKRNVSEYMDTTKRSPTYQKILKKIPGEPRESASAPHQKDSSPLKKTVGVKVWYEER